MVMPINKCFRLDASLPAFLHSFFLLCSALHYIALYLSSCFTSCFALGCILPHIDFVLTPLFRLSFLFCIAFLVLHYIYLRCSAFLFSALHFFALQCIASCCIVFLFRLSLSHCISSLCSAFHPIAIHVSSGFH